MVTPTKFTFGTITGDLIGNLVTVPAYISGESNIKALFAKFRAKCYVCNTEKEIDVSVDPKQLYGLLTKTVGAVPLPEVGECKDGKQHKWKAEKIGPPLTYQVIIMRDSLESAELSGPTTNSTYRGFILGKVPESKDAELEGILFINPKNDDIELLVNATRPTSTSIDAFELAPEDVQSLRAYFSGMDTFAAFDEFAKKNNPRIAGHAHAKLAVLLAYVSPTWIRLNGQLKAGTLRVLLFGDPRQGKGSIADYPRQKLSLGKHAIGETSSRTGITYTIDTERGIIILGVMVEADRGLVVLEALHKFPAEDLATMRETLVKLFVEVRRSFTAKAWARTRVIADSNARQEMGLYPFQCMALRDLPCFKDQVDITRWDLPVVFVHGEVGADEIVAANLEGTDDNEFLESFKKLVPWVWSRKPEQIRFTQEALEEAKKAYKNLLATYSLPEIPIIHEDSLISMLRVATAFAALSFSTPDGSIIEVTRRHIELATDFIVRGLDLLEVAEYKLTRGVELTDADKKEYYDYLGRSDLAAQVVDAISKGPKRSGDLEAELARDASSIRRTCSELKARGVVDRISAGYRLTKKGVLLWREFHQHNAGATNATNATAGEPGYSRFEHAVMQRLNNTARPGIG